MTSLFEVVPDHDPYAYAHYFAEGALREHGLTELGWKFEISKTKLTLGQCFHDKKLIVFSSYYLHIPVHEIRDTILHEIAHALLGPRHGHDAAWRQMAIKVGARPERLARPENKTSATANYVMKCPRCDRKWYRIRMRRRNFGGKCPRCNIEVNISKLEKHG